MNRVERAAIKTLSYRAIFDYPLSFAQIQNYLITKKAIQRKELEEALRALKSSGQIIEANSRYHLKNVKPVVWRSGEENSKALIKKAQKIGKIISKIPWVKFVGVTGSVAAFNAAEKDDIDILVITDERRLWLVRGFVFLILKIMGELRTDKTPGRKICPNILIDESNLAWVKKNRNTYVAHEIAMVYPIFDRDDTYLKFLHANSWILRFFGNLKFGKLHFEPIKPKWNLLDPFESLARSLQLKYMSGKRTTEVTKDNIIHFNRDDHTKNFLGKFEEIKNKELK